MLSGKTVVISGVGPGLGGEVARLALRDGANVAIGARSEARLAEIAKELDPSGERILAHGLDISDLESCERFLQAVSHRFGSFDALVEVAALDAVFGTLESQTAEEWRRVLEVNVIGTLQLARSAVPHLKQRGGGAIVLIGSQSFELPPMSPQIAYASSKGALMSAMYHMASELGPHRIRVNTVVPTWMWGPPVQLYVKWQSRERKVSEEVVKAEITARMPLGEIPADEDVAEAVLFFCSDRARMITGQSLRVDAGEKMA
jgi:NAD(P)-dependent dehydrogenase (short-subunit alcohol dehydrogenase family)